MYTTVLNVLIEASRTFISHSRTMGEGEIMFYEGQRCYLQLTSSPSFLSLSLFGPTTRLDDKLFYS